MKILLANAPWYKGDLLGVRAGSRWPHLKIKEEEEYMPYPFYLGYSFSLLDKKGFSVKLIDALADKIKKKEFLKACIEYKPDFILLEASITSLSLDLSYAKELKEKTNAIVAFSGPLNIMYTKEFFIENPFIDLVFVGEYEKTLLEVVENYTKKKSLSKQPGTILNEGKDTDTTLTHNIITDLNELPWPERNSLQMEHYIDAPGGMPLPCAQVWASRGCPFGCSFCMWPQTMYGSSKYRVRDTKDIVDEMEFLVNELGFKSIYFDDDTFNIGKERMLALCSEIKARKLGVPWGIMARADQMDEELLDAFNEAGLFSVKYGVETASPELMKQITKGLDLIAVKKIIKKTHSLGIKTHLTFTFGIPGETWETINKTINLALDLDPHSVQFSILTPFPNTKLYETLKKKGNILTYDFSKYDGNYGSVIKTDNLTKEDLENAIILAYAKWQKHKNQTYFDMKSELEKKQEEYDALGVVLSNVEKNHKETHTELQRVISEFSILEKANSGLEEDYTKLENQNKKTYTELQRVISEFSNFEKKFSELNEKKDILERDYKKIMNVVVELRKDNLRLKNEHKKTYDELQRVISEFLKLENANDELTQTNDKLQKNNKETYTELQRVISEFKKFEKEHTQLQEDNKKISESNDKLNKEYDSLQQKYEKLFEIYSIELKNLQLLKSSFFFPIIKKELKHRFKKKHKDNSFTLKKGEE